MAVLVRCGSMKYPRLGTCMLIDADKLDIYIAFQINLSWTNVITIDVFFLVFNNTNEYEGTILEYLAFCREC